MVHFMTVSLTLWLGCNQFMIRQSLSKLVMQMLITLSGRSGTLHPARGDHHGTATRDGLDFCNMSGYEQLVRCPTHIAGNRYCLVISDVPDIVDVFVVTPLGT